MISESMQEVFRQVDEALRETDPQGLIRMGAPADEYQNLIPGIAHVVSVKNRKMDLMAGFCDIFADWFSTKGAGSPLHYAPLVEKLWPIVQARLDHARQQGLVPSEHGWKEA